MNRSERPSVLVIEAQAKAALPAIESLGRGGLRVVAASEKRFCTGFYSRCCRERVMYPSPRHEKTAFQEWLLDFLKRRKIEMIYPLGHYGAAAVSEIQEEVSKYTIFFGPDHETFLAAYYKIPTMKTAIEAGVPIPESWFPSDHPDGLEGVLPQIDRWPVLVKPDLGVGARGIVWCHNTDEVRTKFAEIEAEFGTSYIQDFVPPGGMQHKVDMLVDANQKRLAGVVYGKTRMYPPDGGSSVLNYSADRPDILDYAHQMLVQLKWVGFCDFDFVDDPRDGQAKIMEINPRFPESFRMGTSIGIDFPMMMYRLAHGERVEPMLDYPKKRFLRFLFGDLLWFMSVDNKRRFSTWPNWFKFLDAGTAYQLCSLRDPGPIMGYALENLSMMLDSKMRKERIRADSKKDSKST